MIKIIADENIPWVREAFIDVGEVVLLPGRAIRPEAVREADALLVRSVTPVDEALLKDSRVRFVGSATIGTDHVDLALLERAGIAFSYAPGSNAGSVAEYVLAALLELAVRRETGLSEKKLGVVGCGNVGAQVADRAEALGLRVLRCDPPLAEAAEARGETHPFVPFSLVLAEADILSLHTPLTRTGPHSTFHLMDENALRQLRPGTWLLNTSRGAVMDSTALRRHADRFGALVFDVWENEPTPDPALIRAADLATPHIAGYSYDGKVNGTVMLYEAFVSFFKLSRMWNAAVAFAPHEEDHLHLVPLDPALAPTPWLHALTHQAYDLAADDRRFRHLLDLPPSEHADFFSALRRDYPRRRTFDLHTLDASAVPHELKTAVTEGLRFGMG